MYNGWTPEISNAEKFGNVMARLVDCVGLIAALEIAVTVEESLPNASLPEFVREMDFQTRKAEQEAHETALDWEKLAGDWTAQSSTGPK